MGDTDIEWTDAVWNPVRGCSRVSPGCGGADGGGCYAERFAHRFSGPGQPYDGLTRLTKGGPRWTGKVRCVPEMLGAPLHWKKPRRVFVNSMSDLFHEDVPDEFILRVFDVMRSAHGIGHVFQVLTKRAERMADFCRRLRFDAGRMNERAGGMFLVGGPAVGEVERGGLDRMIPGYGFSMVMHQLWLGVSVEDQRAADERIPELLDTPAAVRWISAEPLLGPVNLWAFLASAPRDESLAALRSPPMPGLSWVVCGGESGARPRPCDLAWIRSIVEQCRAAHVPCFVKQLGGCPVMSEDAWREQRPVRLLDHREAGIGPGRVRLAIHGQKGKFIEEWPEDLRVREMPEAPRG